MQSLYTILITDRNGSTIADVTDMCKKRRYVRRRNRPENIELAFDLDDLRRYLIGSRNTADELLRTNSNEVHIYRGDSQIVAGQIIYRDVAAADSKSVTIQAAGWLQMLAHRYTGIGVNFVGVDIGMIMWGLIDAAQAVANGDMGITQGTIQASRLAERNTYDFKNIKDAIVQLSEVINAPDFSFTPEKAFNVWYPKQGRKLTDVSLSYPGNILSIAYTQDGEKMANQIIALGAGTGTDAATSIQEDLTAQASYGLRQKKVQYNDVIIQSTLDDHANEELRTSVGFFELPEITIHGYDPVVGSYDLGDEINVAVSEDVELFGHINGFHRIDEIDTSVDENDVETIRLTFGS
jgi:hypothetical protein